MEQIISYINSFQLTTFHFYGVIIFVLLLADGLQKRGVSEKIMNRIIFVLILCFCLFRYDTNPDYFNYVRMFTKIRLDIAQEDSNVELGYKALNLLFINNKQGFVYVFAICSVIYVTTFHLLFKKLNILKLGWFFTITMMLLGDMNNIIRQAVAMGLFAVALPYVEERKLTKFLLLMVFAFLIHYTAIICLPYYWLSRYYRLNRVNKSVWIISLILVSALSFLGIFQTYTIKLFELVPHYSHYVDFLHYSERKESKSGLGLILMTVLGIIVILMRDKVDEKYRMYINMSAVYIVLYLVLSDAYVLFRIASYLQIFLVISLSLILKAERVVDYIKLGIVLLCLTWWARYSYYGNRPYRTVFSDYYKEGKYYRRHLGIKGGHREINDYFIYNYNY